MRAHMAQSKNGYLDKAGQVRWLKKLGDRGWIAPDWPVELGGAGWSLAEVHLRHGDGAGRRADLFANMGLKMCAPVMMAFGTLSRRPSTCRRS
jgi:alkylation response protein AidB-like acyl-CoA dehydrogenase